MLRPWQLIVTLERDSTQALHLQITQAISVAIRSARLPPGTPLPGTRVLAAELGLNRKTVVLAYDELAAQGWIETQAKRGAFVCRKLPRLEMQAPPPTAANAFPLALPDAGLAAYAQSLGIDSPDRPVTISFSDGVPDTRLIPFDVLSRAYRHALLASARLNQLAYGDPRGNAELRAALAEMLRMERGLHVQAQHVCVVRGSQMGIYLAARLLVRPGDGVVLEALSYPPAREAFKSFGAQVLSVAQDQAGICVDDLERLCLSQPIRAVYLTPHHQFPTTCMMPAERRVRLIELAKRFNFVIIEDDYDHEFHFAHSPMLPLASMEHGGRVIHIGSLSKVLAPGLRLGYIVAPSAVIDRCAAEIMLIDRQGNVLTELAVTELMRSGELKRHIRRALKSYEQRRDYAAASVRRHLPEATFDLPPGGLALWLHLAPAIDVRILAEDALAEGVRILPGSLFAAGDTPVPGFRLGYANLNETEFDAGMVRLSRAFARQRE